MKKGCEKMYKILIADDESKIRALVKKYAVFEGHEVAEAADGMQAIDMCKNGSFDIIILDVMMPELDGFSACREIRKISDTPILMLSARSEEYDRIHGFEDGVDDYVVKPFSPRELMLRIDAIVRRSRASKNPSGAAQSGIFTCLGLCVDFSARTVSVDAQKIAMSPKEYDLLFYMVRNKRIALTREKLITEVWGYDYFGADRTLDTHIKLLRKRLGEYARFIVTLRGVGYRFETD